MDVEKTMQFILDCQARTEASLAAMAERAGKTDAILAAMAERADRTDATLAAIATRADKTEALLRRAIRLGIREARAERRRRQELDKRFDEKMTQLSAAQFITEEKLQGLIDSLRRGSNGHS